MDRYQSDPDGRSLATDVDSPIRRRRRSQLNAFSAEPVLARGGAGQEVLVAVQQRGESMPASFNNLPSPRLRILPPAPPVSFCACGQSTRRESRTEFLVHPETERPETGVSIASNMKNTYILRKSERHRREVLIRRARGTRVTVGSTGGCAPAPPVNKQSRSLPLGFSHRSPI